MDLPPIVLTVLGNAAGAYAALQGTRVEVAETDATVADASASSSGAMNLLGVAALGAGVAAVHMAGDFDASTERLVTDGGEQQSALGGVQNQILDMMGQVGDSASELTAGMNTIESAGFHAANGGLTVLQDAAEGAKVGGADLGTMADALTSDLNAYGQSASSAAADTDEMIATVAAGKLHMQDLASSISTVLPVAAAAKLSYAQVGGALATMTAQGVSAQQGTQDLASTIRALQNPNNVAISTMQQLGLSATDVSQNLGSRGLTGTLQLLSQAVAQHMGPDGLAMAGLMNQSASATADANAMIQKMPASLQQLATAYLNGTISQSAWNSALQQLPPLQANLAKQFATVADTANGFSNALKSGNPAAQTFNALMGDMLGGQDGLNTALMLTSAHAQTFQNNVNAIAAAGKNANGTITDWSEVQGQFNTKLDQAKGAAEALGIRLGNVLLPFAQRLLDTTMGLVDWFGRHKTAAEALGAVIGGVLAVATASYLLKLGQGIVAAGGNLIEFGSNTIGAFGKVAGAAGDAAGAIGSFASGAAGTLASAGSSALQMAATFGRGIATAAGVVAEFAVDMGMMAARAAVSFATMAVDALVWAGEMLVAGLEAMAPFLPIIAVVAAVGIAAYELYTHWNTVWSFIKQIVSDGYDWIKAHLQLIIDVALGPLVAAISWLSSNWQAVWHDIESVVSAVWDDTLQPIFHAISSAISAVTSGLSGISHLAGSVGSFLGFDDGGWVPGASGSPMLAVVHGGEYVLSRDMIAGRAAIDTGIGSGVIGGLAQGSSAAGPGAGGGASITQQTVVLNTGTVISDQDLVTLVQRGFLRQGARYSSSYTPYRR